MYNIAQNQSFVQKEIGAKYKIPGFGIPFQIFQFLAISSFRLFFIDNKLTLLLYKNSLKSILELQFFALCLVGFFFIIVTI